MSSSIFYVMSSLHDMQMDCEFPARQGCRAESCKEFTHHQLEENGINNFQSFTFRIKEYDSSGNKKFEALRDLAVEHAIQNEGKVKALTRTLILCGSKQVVS